MSERSRPIIVDIAISAPARSIEAHAMSTSRLRITSRIETLVHEHVVHRHLERVGVDPLAHREVALRVEVDAEHAVTPLDERGGEVERRRRLRDTALLVGEGDDLGLGRSREPPVPVAGASWAPRRFRACARTVPLRKAYSHVAMDSFNASASSAWLPPRQAPGLVTGKGGVGRTTVATALGLAARRASARSSARWPSRSESPSKGYPRVYPRPTPRQ